MSKLPMFRSFPTSAIRLVRYSATIKNGGTGRVTDLLFRLILPPTIALRQRVQKLKFFPEYANKISDEFGNTWMEFKIEELGANDRVAVGYSAEILCRTVGYPLGRSIQSAYVPPLLHHYTKPESALQSDHPKIVAISRKIERKFKEDAVFAAEAMKEVKHRLKYRRQKEERGAAYAIETGQGDCTEFSSLFVAVCRSKGIPARLQSGFSYTERSWGRHAWAEVWLGGIWVPADPTWNGDEKWLGLTGESIVLKTGNWMNSNVRSETSWEWKYEGDGRPKVDTDYSVTHVKKQVDSASYFPIGSPCVRISTDVPSKLRRGALNYSDIELQPLKSSGCKSSTGIIALCAVFFDGKVDHIISSEPIQLKSGRSVRVRFRLQIPNFKAHGRLTFLLLADGKIVCSPSVHDISII